MEVTQTNSVVDLSHGSVSMTRHRAVVHHKLMPARKPHKMPAQLWSRWWHVLRNGIAGPESRRTGEPEPQSQRARAGERLYPVDWRHQLSQRVTLDQVSITVLWLPGAYAAATPLAAVTDSAPGEKKAHFLRQMWPRIFPDVIGGAVVQRRRGMTA